MIDTYKDIEILVKVLDELVRRGNSLFIIEHNLEIIRNADYIIDMGPEGGKQGGKVIFQGRVTELKKGKVGWTSKYRENNKDKVFNFIENIDKSKSKRVNIFAPDDFSCSFYDACINKILSEGLLTNFGSMRLDRFEKIKKIHKKNFLFRIGIDGLSERIRKIINKPIKDSDIINLITKMAKNGFVMFKFFMIFSYKFENMNDFDDFYCLIQEIKYNLKDLQRPIFLRIKFTPLIPNPLTPLEKFYPYYNEEMRERIELFFLRERHKRSNVVIINDGILEPYNYYAQAFLARCHYQDICIEKLKNRKLFNFESMEYAKNHKIKNNNVITYIPKSKRETFYEKLQNNI